MAYDKIEQQIPKVYVELATKYLMTVIDGWYSAALVVRYTVGGFRHYLFFQKVCGPLSQEVHVYRSIQRHRHLWHLLRAASHKY